MHAIVGILGQIMSLLGGGIAGGLKLVSNIFVAGAKMALQYHQEAIAFSREVGMSAKQAQAYTEVLTTRAKNLGEKYGIASEAVKELERNLARASGRAMILTDADAERMIQINKLVGPETANRFTEEIMQGMGGQLETVEGAVSKAYATAAKRGLNAQKFSEKVAQNLSMANKLSFKNGVDGITKMTALSEKLGFNLQSVENAANKFMNLQDSIENAAKLSMLGGAAGAFGGNALDMSYEANYDPEAFTERMTKMLGGYAQFNEKTGMSKVNGMSMDFVRGIADAMGLDPGEATRIAKKQAEMKYKESKFGNRFGNLNDEQRDLIMNKSYVKDGKLMINDMNGQARDISGGQIPPKLLEELEQFGRMDDRQLMEQQATTLISINEQIEGIKTAFSGHIAEAVSKHLPEIQNFIGEMGRTLMAHAPAIASNFEKLMTTALKPENVSKVMEFVKGFINFASWVTKFLTQNWAILLGAMFFNPILKGLRALFGAGGGGGASSAASAAAKGKGNHSWKQSKAYAKKAYNKTKGNIFKKGLAGAKSLWKNSKLVRGVVKGGTIAGLAGMAVDYGADYLADNGTIEKGGTAHTAAKTAGGALEYGSLGAAIGTAVAGPVGTIVGGAIGAIGGGILGYMNSKSQKEENPATNNSSAAMPRTTEGRNTTITDNSEPHAIGGYAGGVKPSWYVGGNSLSGDKVKAGLNSGEAVATVNDQLDFLSAIKDIRKAVGLSNSIAYNTTTYGGSKGVSTYSAQNVTNGVTNSSYNSQMNSNSTNAVTKNGGNESNYLYSRPFSNSSSSIFSTNIDNVANSTNSINRNGISTYSINSNDRNESNPVYNSQRNGISSYSVIGGNSSNIASPVYNNQRNGVSYYSVTGGNNNELNRNYNERNSYTSTYAPYNSINNTSNPLYNGLSNAFSTYSVNTVNGNSSNYVYDNANDSILTKNSKIFGGNVASSSYSNSKNNVSTFNSFNSNFAGNTILPETQKSNLQSLPTDVKAKPVGGKEPIYVPNTNQSNRIGGEITVRDFNINLGGTLRLDGGGNSQNIDIRSLLNDVSFISSLKDIIKESFASDINGGRIMFDTAYLRGMPSQSTTMGRLTS